MAGSGCLSQRLDQRIKRRGLWLNDPEFGQVGSVFLEQLATPDAPGVLDMLLDQPPKMMKVCLHTLGRDAMNVDESVLRNARAG